MGRRLLGYGCRRGFAFGRGGIETRFGPGMLLRILARVFGLGFLVGGALGVRTGVRAERRYVMKSKSADEGERSAPPEEVSLRQLRQRLYRASQALFGPEEADAEAPASEDRRESTATDSPIKGSSAQAQSSGE